MTTPLPTDTSEPETDHATPAEEADTPEAPVESETEQPDVFPREVVEKLRHENGKYRLRAQQADALAQRLHTELVRATGRLADPDDLPFDAAHLDDADTLTAAIDDILARKPHLASRRPFGDIGQGATTSTGGPVDLAALLRSRA